MPPTLLETRDITATLASLRRELTPYPAEQRLTLYALAAFVAFTAVSLTCLWVRLIGLSSLKPCQILCILPIVRVFLFATTAKL